MTEQQETEGKEPISEEPAPRTEVILNDVEKLLKEQLAASTAILQEVAAIKGHIRWQKVWSTLRFFLIIVPILLGLLYGLLYLPPEIKETLDYYRALFLP